MIDYDAIVIGAGCGGLTSAVTLAQNGLKVLMLEKHNVPGGCAQSFCRGRFEFEASLHQLSGVGEETNPGPVRQLLEKMGALDKVRLIKEDLLYRVKIEGTEDISIPAGRKDLLHELTTQFPEDRQEIEAFIKFIYQFTYERSACVYGHDSEASPEKYPLFFKYGLRDTQSVLDEYLSNPVLHICFGSYIGYMGLPAGQLPFGELISTFLAYVEYKPYHFAGGSQAMSNALVSCFTEAGGDVIFNCAVEKIIVEDGEVKGVKTQAGDQYVSNLVISNASTVDTYMHMVDPDQVASGFIDDINSKRLGVSAVTVYLGLDCEASEIGINTPLSFLYGKGKGIDDMYGSPHDDAGVCCLTCYSAIDPGFSPLGTSQIAIIVLHEAEPWLSIPPHEYKDIKYRYAESVLRLVERFYPGLRDHIEEVDISTPITHMRYLGTPGGSIYGFAPQAKDLKMFDDKKGPIRGLYQAGAWVAGGGYQPSLMSGVAAGKAVAKQFQRERTS